MPSLDCILCCQPLHVRTNLNLILVEPHIWSGTHGIIRNKSVACSSQIPRLFPMLLSVLWARFHSWGPRDHPHRLPSLDLAASRRGSSIATTVHAECLGAMFSRVQLDQARHLERLPRTPRIANDQAIVVLKMLQRSFHHMRSAKRFLPLSMLSKICFALGAIDHSSSREDGAGAHRDDLLLATCITGP